MLRVQEIDVFYGIVPALHQVSLEVASGETVCLLGPNGAGKTTTVKSIVGLLTPRGGRIRLNETDITGLPPHRTIPLGISLAPEGRLLFPDMSVDENLELGAASTGARARKHDGLDWVYSLFPRLKARQGQAAGTLSGGEQQMLAIARALVSNPVLLLMDEPTEGLAPALVREVSRLILRLKDEGMTILLVEQNIALAAKVADEAHVMSKGQIVYSSSPRELWENQEIKTRFLGVPTNT